MMKRLKGAVTIYLTLVLVLVLTLVCTLIESARVNAVRTKLRSVTYMAADSVFSAFAEPLFSEYGVMAVWEDEEKVLEEFNDYISYNLGNRELSGGLNLDLYGMEHVGSTMENSKKLTDDAGMVFEDQVCEYMRYYLAEDAASKLLDGVSIFDQGDKVNGFMEKIEEYRDTFIKVEESVESIKEVTDKIKSVARDPASLLGDMRESLEKYIETDGKEGKSDFKSAFSDLKSTGKKIKGYLETVQDKTEEYYENVEEAKGCVTQLEQELDIDKAGYSEDVYEAVKEQVDELKEKSADTGVDYYGVVENEGVADGMLSDLERLDNLQNEIGDSLTTDNAERYLAVVRAYESDFSGFDLSALGVDFEKSAIAKEDDGFIDSVGNLFSQGILSFVAGGEVSENEIDVSELPSNTVDKSKPEAESISLLEATANKALLSEYILTHFGNFRQPKEGTALQYEAEYILAGEESDDKNLGQVVTEIVLIRTGCNLISILKDSGKKAETYALATSLVGFTGQPIIIKVVQILLIAAWALAESIADVKALLAGHKVPALKSKDDWYISLMGLKNFSGDSIGEATGSESGLTYENYLRILLLMEGRVKQDFRTMDVIQANMCLNEQKDFRMEECVVKAEFGVTYEAKEIFVKLPFVMRNIGAGRGKYEFCFTQKYEY